MESYLAHLLPLIGIVIILFVKMKLYGEAFTEDSDAQGDVRNTNLTNHVRQS